MIDAILDFFFPPKCPFCMEILSSKAPVCDNCISTLPFNDEKCCDICSRPIEDFSYSTCLNCREQKIYFEHSFVPLIYKDEAKEAVLRLKKGHPSFSKGFAYLLADKILSSPNYKNFDVITFVPQSYKGRLNRGYNQAELIARDLSKLLNIPCITFLIKTDDGEEQHLLTATQRRENVKKCYFSKNIKGKGRVLLVDDIYTTGSTTNHCSRLLRKMGFSEVYLAVAMIRTDD